MVVRDVVLEYVLPETQGRILRAYQRRTESVTRTRHQLAIGPADQTLMVAHLPLRQRSHPSTKQRTASEIRAIQMPTRPVFSW